VLRRTAVAAAALLPFALGTMPARAKTTTALHVEVSNAPYAAFGSDGPLNWPGYDDAGFRERLAKSDAANTEAARNAWLRAAEQRLLNADAVVPLYFYTSKHLVDDRVLGYEANALDRHASRWLRLRP